MTEPPPVLHPSGAPQDRRDQDRVVPGLLASGPAVRDLTSERLGSGMAAGSGPPAPAGPTPGTSATGPAPEASTPGAIAAAADADAATSGPRRTADASPPAPRPAATLASAPDGPVVIAAPLAALLEPSPEGLSLPRIGADGLAPMHAYARPFSAPPGAKLVAIVLDGIGLSESDSLAAINTLPGAVDLAISPYAPRPEALLRQARSKGHELLASIPMEPAGAPLNDEGARALTIDATPEANEANLDRVLGRIQGYAGATGGSDGQRGEHFALSGRPFDEVTQDLAARGLLYIGAAREAGAGGRRVSAGVAQRGVDLVVDEPAGAAALDARLARLESLAQENGAALGLAGPPRPVTVERLAAWAKGLASRGLVLAPASALVRTGRTPTSGIASGSAPGDAAPQGARATAASASPGSAPEGTAAPAQARRTP